MYHMSVPKVSTVPYVCYKDIQCEMVPM